MANKYFLAIDIGASSGRHIIGYKENNELITKEIYRFSNGVIEKDGHLIWDIDSLYNNVKEGIKLALANYKIESLSIDTWGVDYVLMNNDKEIYPVYSYRDNRTNDIIPLVHSIIDFNTLYQINGIQFQPFNTIYQLYKDKLDNRLAKATDFFLIPEYLIYKLTNIKIHEYTNASTTALLDSKTNTYSKEIINKLGFNPKLFNELAKPGTLVGSLSPDIAKELGGNTKVVLCPTHDTASAVRGIEMLEDSIYLSSGTWSLLGIKTDKVINSIEARLANYSNEYGPNYIRFQKNIMGLWIIQVLAKEYNLDFPTMVELARKSNYKEIYDVNDNCFLSSLNMTNEIVNWFKNNGLKEPKNISDIINSTYISLAYSYKIAIKELENITNKKYKNLYIVGGGAKNKHLNELVKEYTKLNVIAMPIEATAIGNLLSQMEVCNA